MNRFERDRILGSVEEMFRLPSFEAMWDICHTKYGQLCFSDRISDEERIAEYKWITQQFRKYVFSHQTPINKAFENGGVEGVLSQIEELMQSASEYGTDRKTLAYTFIRDNWLANLHQLFSYLAETEEEEE